MTRLDEEMTRLVRRTRMLDLGLQSPLVCALRGNVRLILESAQRVLDLMNGTDQQTVDLLERPEDNPLVKLLIAVTTDPAGQWIRPDEAQDFQDFCDGTGRWNGQEPFTDEDDEQWRLATEESRRFDAELQTLLEVTPRGPAREWNPGCAACGRPISAYGHCGC